MRDRIYFHEPLETGKLTVGTLTVGRVTGEPSIHVSIPYRDNRADGVMVLILNPEKIAQDFESRLWPPQHRLTVFDRNGSVVLRIPRLQETATIFATRTSSSARAVPLPARSWWIGTIKRPSMRRSSVSSR